MLLVEWFINRHTGPRGFVWAACLTIVGSFWIGLQTDPGNFIMAYPALILVFSVFIERWRKFGLWLVVLSMLALTFGIWEIFLQTVAYTYQPIQSPILFIPLPVFLFVTLYWVRWWAIHPPRMYFDSFIENNH